MNVYERIFNIVNLLKEVETGISINKISEILGMPTEIIREDIKNIYKDTKFEISIFPYDDTLDTDDFMDELSLGKHDDVDLCADDFDDEYCTLTLTPLENVVWKSVLHKKDNNDDIKIKRLYADDVGICGKVIIIQNAMNKNVNVKIRYNSKQGILNKEIPPVKIVKFIDKNLFYLISIENGELAYYRIKSCSPSGGTSSAFLPSFTHFISNFAVSMLVTQAMPYSTAMRRRRKPARIGSRPCVGVAIIRRILPESKSFASSSVSSPGRGTGCAPT